MICTVTKSNELIVGKQVSFINGLFDLSNTDTFLIELIILAASKVNFGGINLIGESDSIFDLLIELIFMLF